MHELSRQSSIVCRCVGMSKIMHQQEPLTPPRTASPSNASDDSGNEEPVLRRHKLRTVVMRAGTSKGLFLRLEDLPHDQDAWGPIILSAMGSPDPNSRQLDGMGGGASTTSKVAVVSPSLRPDADVDYLFIQGESGSATIVCPR